MKRTCIALLAVIALSACAGNAPPNGQPTPPVDQGVQLALSLVAAICPGLANPIGIAEHCAQLVLQPGQFLACARDAGCSAPTLQPTVVAPSPTVTPTAAPVATVAATPGPAPTGTPAVVKISSVCDKDVPQPVTPSVFVNAVRKAISTYQAAFPERFDGAFYKFPYSQDDFLWGVCSLLSPYGLDCINDWPSGDLSVTSSAFPMGDKVSFAEQYHPLSSWDPLRQTGRLVQQAPYLERCAPRWWCFVGSAACQAK